MAAGERFCRVCGRDAGTGIAPPVVAGSTGSPVPSKTSGKAIVSLVCGLAIFVPLAFIVAIIFGHLGLSEIRKSAGRLTGEGIAIAGLVLGYLGIVLSIPMILIIAAIAIPNLLRARMAANESSAVASVRTINVAEISYSSQHQDLGFTCSLSDLTSLIDSNVASGQKSGYTFQLTGCSAGTEGGAIVKYQVVAVPVNRNQTGIRAFCSDESAVIKVSADGMAQDCLDNGALLNRQRF